MTLAPRLDSIWRSRFFLAFFVMAVVVTALSVWAVRRSTAPLAMFAWAAERLGRDVNAPDLPNQRRRVPLENLAFADLPGSELTELSSHELIGLASVTRTRSLSAREELFHKGDEANELYVVVSGHLKITTTSSDGNDLMFGLRLAVNDPAGSEPLAGFVRDTGTSASAASLEASRRLEWRVHTPYRGRMQ